MLEDAACRVGGDVSDRVIFAQYFGEDTPLLADRNYSSPWDYPYAFVDVSERQHGPTLAAPHGSIGGAESGEHRS